MRHLVIALVCFAVCLGATEGAAQDQSKPRLGHVSVRMADRAEDIKGQLVSLGPDTVRLIVKDQEVTIPLNRVLHVRSGRDPVWDGALKGAAFGGIMCAVQCAQIPQGRPVLGVAASATLGWAGIGALLDLISQNHQVLFPNR